MYLSKNFSYKIHVYTVLWTHCIIQFLMLMFYVDLKNYRMLSLNFPPYSCFLESLMLSQELSKKSFYHSPKYTIKHYIYFLNIIVLFCHNCVYANELGMKCNILSSSLGSHDKTHFFYHGK